MSEKKVGIPYARLVAIADTLLEEAEDDTVRLVHAIDALEGEVREELLVSDQLNAYQVFYYFFRTEPDLLAQELLDLEPASSLVRGLKIEETNLLEMVFTIHNTEPVIMINDGDKIVATFLGDAAYKKGRDFFNSPAYQ
ncbi:MAG: hypothetical protein WCF90_03965 [Methanomicrobiales archaeon]